MAFTKIPIINASTLVERLIEDGYKELKLKISLNRKLKEEMKDVNSDEQEQKE